MWGSFVMEHAILLNNTALLSYPIMLSYDTMKESHRQTTSFQTQLPTSEGVMALSFYPWWQGGTVGHPLSCCNCCFCITTCLKTVNYNPSFTVHGFPLRILSFGRRKRQWLQAVSFSRIKITSNFHIGVKLMKKKKTNTTECRSIT